MFYSKKIDDKLVICSDLIPELKHFFTTRESVIKSNEPNVDIESNINSILEYLGINRKDFISPIQIHSTNIETVGLKKDYPDTDALILKDFKNAIYLNFADCVPIILYDKNENIGAIAHSGWRGTASSISIKTAERMCNLYNCKKNNIFAVIGPAISKCCFNIGEEVADKIQATVQNSKGLIEKRDNKYYADLKMTNARQLTEFGIPESNIDICPYCTVCNNNLFFSYRKENKTTSRHSAVIKLNQLK